MLKMRFCYGLDAPYVVYLNFLGAVCLLGLLILSRLCSFHLPLVVEGWMLLSACLCLGFCVYMLFSSYVGKFWILRSIFEKLPLQGTASLLDVGCGRGSCLLMAASYLPEGKLVGIDIWRGQDLSHNSPQALQRNIAKYLKGTPSSRPSIEIMQMDMRHLNFESGAFDVVVSCLALHNLRSQEERQTALLEMLRVVKSPGTLILIDFCRLHFSEKILCQSTGYHIHYSKRNFLMFPGVRVLVLRRA